MQLIHKSNKNDHFKWTAFNIISSSDILATQMTSVTIIYFINNLRYTSISVINTVIIEAVFAKSLTNVNWI